MSRLVMARVAREHRLVGVVVPPPRGSFLGRIRRVLKGARTPLAGLGAPIIEARALASIRPDIIVVASFPQILSASILEGARIGALNVHMSLLPRHRGIDPIFWTYWGDDRDAGVTIHWMDKRVDAGGLADQESVPLERGLASRELYMRLSSRGAELVAGVLAKVASGNAQNIPQDESRASHETAADIASACVPIARWPAERVWHVLSGLGDQRSSLLVDASGARLPHGRATGYRIAGGVEPGRIVRLDAGYEVHCLDGTVRVERRA